MKNQKSKELLNDFIKFCEVNPELRFWQALRNWCNKGFVLVADGDLEAQWDDPLWKNVVDTYYWETKDGEPKEETE